MHVIVLALALAADAASPNVTLPLDQYERLRQLRERPSVTVVDLLRVEGSFARRDLAISLAGRASGTLPTAEVLSGQGFRLHSCDGDAIVARAESGAFAVTPLAPRFRVRCRIAVDGSDRLQGQTTRAVLEVAAAVPDGELVASDADEGAREFSVVRRIAGGGEELPPSVAGRYRVTLLPDETRFLYRLEVRNPSRSHRRFELPLDGDAHVEAVDAPVAWDAERGVYRFDLPPGETAIAVSGRLARPRFAPPVAAALQYLLVESHPLLRAEVTSGAKRVGVGEVGLPAQYRGAQAFLLGDGEVTWRVTKLEALKTAGFAVPSLAQVFFLGADGQARGESTIEVDNQGAPALALPVSGEPTFASVQGEPAFLTRDDAGRLFLPLAQGTQEVRVQERRPFGAHLGLATATLDLPRLGVPASRASVELRYPSEWIPLYEELAPDARFHLLSPGEVALLVALLVLAERVLALLRLARRRRVALAGALALVAALSPLVLGLALASAAAVLLAAAALALARRISGWRLALAIAGGAAGALVLAAIAAALFPSSRDEASYSPQYANVAKLASRPGAPAAPEAALEAGALARERRPGLADGYQGLPARIDLPDGRRRTRFERELLATDGARRAFVVLASARLVAALFWVAALLALGLAARSRRELGDGARGAWERLGAPVFGGPAAGAAAPPGVTPT